MNYAEFIERVVDDGIAAARAYYVKPKDGEKLRGSIAGFQLCRGADLWKLRELFTTVNRDAHERHGDADYWYWRCRALEVEWVCNVVSSVLINEGAEPLCGHLPTSRGIMKAAEIVGVKP